MIYLGTLSGVYTAVKKDGTLYYRSSFTYKNKHISLGSYNTEAEAGKAYMEARRLIASDAGITDYKPRQNALLFAKWVSIINFRDNGIYIRTPIYLQNRMFRYYYDIHDYYIFDVDDLFYYSEHTITRRGGHMFVNEYGMQVNIMSRYGIQNHAVCGRDYIHVNGDNRDFRYSNIHIINRYNGVRMGISENVTTYTAIIHLNGDFIIGRFDDELTAAVAYNKAADYINTLGIRINYSRNYIEELDSGQYMELYKGIRLSKNLMNSCKNMVN